MSHRIVTTTTPHGLRVYLAVGLDFSYSFLHAGVVIDLIACAQTIYHLPFATFSPKMGGGSVMRTLVCMLWESLATRHLKISLDH